MVRTVLDYFGSGMLTSLLITNTVAGQFPFWGSSKPLRQCIIPIPIVTSSKKKTKQMGLNPVHYSSPSYLTGVALIVLGAASHEMIR